MFRHFLGTHVDLMAWPPSLSSDTSSCSTLHWRSDPLWHRRHRRRKSSLLGPSSALLSILASLVPASADASPAPPPFLCPSIGSDDTVPPWCSNERPGPSGTVDNNPQESGRTRLRPLPDKYEQGGDGIWRRVGSYTLYGVTGPNPDCHDASCQISPSSNQRMPTPPPIGIQLPPGWNPSPKSPSNRTTMILAVSLALSLFICFLIVICLFWRKGLLSGKRKSSDVEAKKGRRQTSEERRNIEAEKEAKALQKIWARASARWKANARHSLRQRRGKRLFIRSHHPSTTSLNDSRRSLAIHTSRPPSILSSRIPNQSQASLAEERHANEARQRPTSLFSSPPAYHADHRIPSIIISSHERTPEPVSSHLSRRPSQADLALFPTIHVATDDKALLARLADLASAPPDETDNVENMSLSQVSAPEDLEFEDHIDSSHMDDLPPAATLFPPPPSKERLAAVERLDYTFGFDDLEPEPEPSAPPFEESSAMLPLDDAILLPSAPPLIDEEADDQGPTLPGECSPTFTIHEPDD